MKNNSNTYYLVFPQFEPLVLGDLSFGTFYTSDGWHIFKKFIKTAAPTEFLDSVKIVDDKNKTYTIEQFVILVESFNLMEN